ncbi:hypothetical protein EPUS_02689 [Endocarpon pusillum Z07020]|uniref:Rhodopsin domain-containing protein n=1 Tax=Endocarpon pusillum (strain Z07020 / HMAS-L-300199) TaxID=1263415 RepID=U1GXW4_ENDPU|nr:uncharacterized protein EPUS_02689 [Endocarpon pusillum Z07020]ERF76976.1 hypothetical protein EPUS_02689 [Endocarpon pusillum Z07020]
MNTHIDPTNNPTNFPLSLIPGLGNHDMADEYRANLDPASVEYQVRVAGSKLHITAWSLYVSTLWCLKLCFAVFYTRLTAGLTHMRIRVYIAYAAISVTYVAVMATLLGSCQPFNHYWQIHPNPGNQCTPAISTVNCLVVVVLDVLTDIYLLHIPLLMLWDAKLSRLKKFFLIVLFSGGIFIIMAGIIRVHFILAPGRKGGLAAAYWGKCEILVAFIIGNVPMIYGGFTVLLRQSKDSKVSARMRLKTKGWLGAERFTSIFSWAARTRSHTCHEKTAKPPISVVLGATESNASAVKQHTRSSTPWAHHGSENRFATNIDNSETQHAEMDSELGIHVTRGIRVEVESLESREGNPDSMGTSTQNSRTDSEAQLGQFMLDTPFGKPAAEDVAKLPSQEKQSRRDHQGQRPGTSDKRNVTKWISEDSSGETCERSEWF